MDCDLSQSEIDWIDDCNRIRKFTGLMFRSSKTKPLMFSFDGDVDYSIHSWFVFFPFLAIWLDSNNRLVDSKVVYPFQNSVRAKNKFRRLIEIPIK